jgi:preprotein translocase subunit SecG
MAPWAPERKFMAILVTIIHIMVSLFLIIVVLIQSGQSGDLAAAFGGQGSQTAFGPRGAATLLTKVTTVCAIVFMLTSITLSVLGSRKTSGSVLSTKPPAQSQPVKK